MSGLELGTLGQVSWVVSDVPRAEAWFREVLGLPHVSTFGDLAFFDCGGTRLFLTRGEPQGAAGNSVLYFRVADIEAAHHELSRRGVAFEGAPHLIHRHPDGTEEWMAFFRDPEGGLLAIMSQVHP